MTDSSSKTHLVDASLIMSPPNGEPLPVHVLTMELEEDGQHRSLSLTLELTVDQWMRIDSERLFHLAPESRQAMSGKFAPGAPVTVRGRLNPALLDDSVDEPRAVWQAMRDGSEVDMLATEAWYALSAGQPGSGANSEADPGFTTTWAAVLDQLWPVAPAVLLPVVLAVFEERDWPHEVDEDEGVVEMLFEGEHGQWRFVVMVREPLGQVICYSIRDEPVPAHRLDDAMRLATLANNRLAVGSFELDLISGEWAFRTSIDVEGDRLSEALFRQLADANLAQFDRYCAAIESTINDAASAEAALALVN